MGEGGGGGGLGRWGGGVALGEGLGLNMLRGYMQRGDIAHAKEDHIHITEKKK